MENTTHNFREMKLVLQLKNPKLKVKLWWVGASERKMSAFFVTFILSKEFFLTFVFYLNDFQNIYTFTYQKELLYTVLLLVLKLPKALSVSLKALFVYLNFCPYFFCHIVKLLEKAKEIALIKLRLISKFMTSEIEKQVITVQTLLNISRSNRGVATEIGFGGRENPDLFCYIRVNLPGAFKNISGRVNLSLGYSFKSWYNTVSMFF